MTTDLTTSMPFAQHCGIAIASVTREEVKGTLAWRTELCTSAGVIHGGALMAMADSLGAVCAFLNLPPGAMTSTIESKTNFFRGVTEGDIQIESMPIHVGRTTIVVQTDIKRPDGKLVSRTIQTQAVVKA